MRVNKLKAENEALRLRLEEADETIRAIRSGAVDAFVVEDAGCHKVYTLKGADRPYRLLVEQMQQGAAMLQGDGTIIYCNLRLAEYLKIPHERLIGAPLHDFIVSDDRPLYDNLMWQGRTRSGRGEARLRGQDGGTMPVYLTFNGLPKDCGAEIGVLITDLTAQKHHERLAEAHKASLDAEATALGQLTELTAMYATAPVGMCLLDQDLRYVRINDQLAEMNGIPAATHLGKTIREMLPFLADKIEPMLRQILQTGEPVLKLELTGETSTRPRVTRTWLGSFVPLRDATGQIIGVNIVTQEITERKQVEEQLRSFATNLEQHVAHRTHELVQSQEALRALASQLSLVEQRERHRLATELHDSLAQLLVAGLMKATQGRQRLSQGSALDDRYWNELVDMFGQAISYTRTLMGELSPSVLHQAGLPSALKWLGENMLRYGLKVEAHVEESKLEIPEDKAVLLFQSTRELLWNVVKHASTDCAVLSLDTSSADYVCVTVQDQGRGFDLTLTEPPSASRGFGLFSVRERIKAMGGEMTLQTSPGKGTCITLKAPIPITSPKRAMSTSLALPATRIAHSGRVGPLRILLVDDHAMVRQGLRGVLVSYPGLSVIGEASNGEEAVRLAEETSPDLILMDVNMPILDGIAATKRVKEILPAAIIVGLSVNHSSHVIEAMTCAGASGFVSKDMAADDLYTTIMSVTELGASD